MSGVKTSAARLEEVASRFESVARDLRAHSMEPWVALDLTMAQLKTLFTLEYSGPATIGGVAEKLGVSLPTASHLVDRLVTAGLARREEDQTDRRRTLASPTASGHDLVVQLRHGGHEFLVQALAQLTAEELAALDTGLAAMSRVLTGSPPPEVRGGCR
ncbi:MAG TPA: MarR family transcriptional regulator [Thermomicrobiaceae bacterium]|nr:MarR family transcriptional regulator [Thermomicrobiaceae bacterium]